MLWRNKKYIILSVLSISIIGTLPSIGTFFNNQQHSKIKESASLALASIKNTNKDSACSLHFETGYKKTMLKTVNNEDEYFISGCGGIL